MNLGTILTAMVTPFDDRDNLAIAQAQKIARWLIERGNDGLVVAGSTGEGQTLDRAERSALWAAMKDAAGDKAAVIANAGTASTRESIAQVRDAQLAGADAILAVVPYYNKPTQSGMRRHFAAIAESTELPIVIYNIPSRTGANMLPETLLELARSHSNVAGVKESSGDLKQIATILADRPKGFSVWCGDDHLFLPCLAIGADGLIGVTTHLCSPQFRRMYDAYRAGRVAEAAAIHRGLLPLFDAIFATTNPIAIKWAMNEAGFDAGACRLPLDDLPAELAERVRPLVKHYTEERQEAWTA